MKYVCSLLLAVTLLAQTSAQPVELVPYGDWPVCESQIIPPVYCTNQPERGKETYLLSVKASSSATDSFIFDARILRTDGSWYYAKGSFVRQDDTYGNSSIVLPTGIVKHALVEVSEQTSRKSLFYSY